MEVHELYFVSLWHLTELVHIIVKVEKSLIYLHLFFFLLFLHLFLFFEHCLFSFLLCDYFRFICLWALSFLNYIQELKSFHRIHNTKISHTLLLKLCLHNYFLIDWWCSSFFEIVACISHSFLILFTLIMTLFPLNVLPWVLVKVSRCLGSLLFCRDEHVPARRWFIRNVSLVLMWARCLIVVDVSCSVTTLLI